MRTTLDRVKLLFLCVLVIAVCCGGIWAHQVFDVWPRKQRCEAMSDWWDPKDHQCGIPMPIWRFTGRMPQPETPSAKPVPKPAASAAPLVKPAVAAAPSKASNPVHRPQRVRARRPAARRPALLAVGPRGGVGDEQQIRQPVEVFQGRLADDLALGVGRQQHHRALGPPGKTVRAPDAKRGRGRRTAGQDEAVRSGARASR